MKIEDSGDTSAVVASQLKDTLLRTSWILSFSLRQYASNFELKMRLSTLITPVILNILSHGFSAMGQKIDCRKLKANFAFCGLPVKPGSTDVMDTARAAPQQGGPMLFVCPQSDKAPKGFPNITCCLSDIAKVPAGASPGKLPTLIRVTDKEATAAGCKGP